MWVDGEAAAALTLEKQPPPELHDLERHAFVNCILYINLMFAEKRIKITVSE